MIYFLYLFIIKYRMEKSLEALDAFIMEMPMLTLHLLAIRILESLLYLLSLET